MTKRLVHALRKRTSRTARLTTRRLRALCNVMQRVHHWQLVVIDDIEARNTQAVHALEVVCVM